MRNPGRSALPDRQVGAGDEASKGVAQRGVSSGRRGVKWLHKGVVATAVLPLAYVVAGWESREPGEQVFISCHVGIRNSGGGLLVREEVEVKFTSLL
jgi:hypothetical protein